MAHVAVCVTTASLAEAEAIGRAVVEARLAAEGARFARQVPMAYCEGVHGEPARTTPVLPIEGA